MPGDREERSYPPGNSSTPAPRQTGSKTVPVRPTSPQEVRDREQSQRRFGRKSGQSASSAANGPPGTTLEGNRSQNPSVRQLGRNSAPSAVPLAGQTGLGHTGNRNYAPHDTRAEPSSRFTANGTAVKSTGTNATPGSSTQRRPQFNALFPTSRAPPVQHTPVAYPTPQSQYFSQPGSRHIPQHTRASFPLPQPTSGGPRMRTASGMPVMRANLPPIFPQHDGSHVYHRYSTIKSMIPSASSRITPPVKLSKPIFPVWQREDEEFERTHPSKRARNEGERGMDFVKRVSIGGNRRDANAAMAQSGGLDRRREAELDGRSKVYMGPKLRLTAEGERVSDPDMDEDPPEQQPRIARKSIGVQNPRVQVAIKAAARKQAARKTESIDIDEDEDEDEVDEEDNESKSSSVPSSEDEDENDELESSSENTDTEDENDVRVPRGRLRLDEDGDVDMDNFLPRGYSPPEIILLDLPPNAVFPPRRGPPINNLNERASGPVTMPEDILRAVETLTLPSILLKVRHRLPFLRRNLWRGFEQRCRALKVPTDAPSDDALDVSVDIRYDYVDEHSYETRIYEWLCPLCTLHRAFKRREMLAVHLKLDHSEVYVEWERVDEKNVDAWRIKLLIPEIPSEHANAQRSPETHDVQVEPEQPSLQDTRPSTVPPEDEISIREETPAVQHLSSPFPFVTLSPSPSTRPSVSTSATSVPHSVDEKFSIPLKLRWQEVRQDTATRSQSLSSSMTRRSATASSDIRSTTAMSFVTTRATEKRQKDPLSFTLPPQDDPLGPAARPPYFPAESEYGGPTVYYSVRPGGACLFDLLKTLPLEPFGVLDWAVKDREEEIYESDDVKEEYKVMHALWARWIMLNRNKFVADYYQGTITFVDEYWKIIHRAAGWDALRYWLLMLLANRFLTGRDVGNVLKHYEEHTGMEFWYNSSFTVP